MSKTDKPRILIFDIETSPYLTYTWKIGYDVSIPHDLLVEEFKVISIAYKWLGEKKVHALQWASPKSDKKMLQDFQKIYSEADCVVGHNVKRFDIKKLRGRMMEHRIEDFPDVLVVDTLTESRRISDVASHKLDYLVKRIGTGGKLRTDFDLWRRCMAGDKEALAYMVKYNKVDVQETEILYRYLEPYMKTINMQVITGNKTVCVSCGSADTYKNGERVTTTGKNQRHRCGSCGKSWTETGKIKDAKPKVVKDRAPNKGK